MLRRKLKSLAIQSPPRERTKPLEKPKQTAYLIAKASAPVCPIEPFVCPVPGWAQQWKLYHRTNRVAAWRIMRHGFRASTNYYLTQRMESGVWLSSLPTVPNQGASGDVLLQVDTDLEENELAQYELVTKKKTGYREWLVPVAVINPRMKVSVVAPKRSHIA
jgi:hypothetical protein